MKQNFSIQLKAALLILVFGFNTVVGFACAIGINMGFNKTHHHDEEATEINEHADGVKHHHDEVAEHKHSNKDEKDDCCHNKVVTISQADKALPQIAKLLNPVFFSAFINVYNIIGISYPSPSQVNTSTKYFVRGHHPPIPDIRIAIQSFQI
jgi:hypothetical protein